MDILVFLFILSVLVVVHELGHYVVAKKTGVCVEEFGLGLPPRVFGKRLGETVYSLNLLPFGGFVKLKGEDSEDSTDASLKDPQNYMSKTPLQRSAILLAGVFMNLTLGILLFYVFFILNGFRTQSIMLFPEMQYEFRFGRKEYTHTAIVGVAEDSGAAIAGVQEGEAILELDDVPVYNLADIRAQVGDKIGQEVKVMLMDLRIVTHPVRVVTVVPQEHVDGRGVLGVVISDSVILSYDQGISKIFAGFLHSYNMLAYTGSTLSKLISFSVAERDIAPVSQSVSGPIGIYTIVGSILEYSGITAFFGLLNFAAIMSLSLAFMNLLPLPALDGGRFALVFLEKVRGKRLNPAVETAVHRWGMLVLLGFLILITAKDIMGIFG